MLRQTTILFLLIILTSCSASYYIAVRHDGSAAVNVDYDPTLIEKYYHNNIITKIDSNAMGGRVSFEILNIDSLGNYLPFHPPNYFLFDMKENTLNITDGHTVAFKKKYRSCCGINMIISFDDKVIKEVQSETKIIFNKKNNSVIICKTRRQLMKGKNKTDMTIKIE